MEGYAEFNINDSVKVKLTDLGRKIHRKEHERIFAGTPYASKYTPPQEDADGYSTWQLWILMDYFGEYVGMARELPFETTILIAQSDVRAS